MCVSDDLFHGQVGAAGQVSLWGRLWWGWPARIRRAAAEDEGAEHLCQARIAPEAAIAPKCLSRQCCEPPNVLSPVLRVGSCPLRSGKVPRGSEGEWRRPRGRARMRILRAYPGVNATTRQRKMGGDDVDDRCWRPATKLVRDGGEGQTPQCLHRLPAHTFFARPGAPQGQTKVCPVGPHPAASSEAIASE